MSEPSLESLAAEISALRNRVQLLEDREEIHRLTVHIRTHHLAVRSQLLLVQLLPLRVQAPPVLDRIQGGRAAVLVVVTITILFPAHEPGGRLSRCHG